MTYNFLTKAKAQPDLTDFCNYLEKPLAVIEDIRTRYNQLKSSQQTLTVNIELRHKCDSIVETHLPALVENFCNFSFGFRNTEKIRVDSNTFLTPKELLLKNLSSIIEEISEIEKEFNTNNSFATLAQTKVLQQYGAKPELCLETGEILKNKNKLENRFDYEQFISESDFKNLNYSKTIESENNPLKIVNEENSDLLTWIVSIFVILGFVSLMAASLYTTAESGRQKLERQKITNDILALNKGVKAAYADNYSGLGKNNIVPDIIPIDATGTPSGINYIVIPESVSKANDSFSINIPITEDSQNSVCEAISTTSSLFEVIKVGSTKIKSDLLTPPATVLKNCLNKTQKFDKIETVKLIATN